LRHAGGNLIGHRVQLDPGRQLGPDIRVEGGGRLTLECLVDGAALLVRQRLEGVGNDDELVVGRVFAENFAGTVSVFAGAPGTAKAPLTSTAFAGGLAFGGGCCWAAARPMLPTNASASALVRTRSTSYGCLLLRLGPHDASGDNGHRCFTFCVAPNAPARRPEREVATDRAIKAWYRRSIA